MNHIALVIPTIDRIAGAERQVILLAKGLVARGWRVTVVALSGTGGDAASELASSGAEFLSLEMRHGLADPRGWFRFHQWLANEKPDVVHAHLPHAAWLARWSRIAAPARMLVDSIHTSSTGTFGRRLGYRLSAWLPDAVTAVGRTASEAWLSARMVAEQTLSVVPNGIDVVRWKPDSDARHEIRRQLDLTHEFLWLAAGRLDPVKDYPTLLRAMAAISPPAILVIAGSGPLETELRRLSSELGLAARVGFLGFETNALRWMQAADAYVLSSRWEGLPMALLEAGACALPAVATAVPGITEVIADGHNGLLAAPGNVAALAAAMTRLMRLPQAERSAMGERARESVIERFSLTSALDQWEALYRNLLAHNPLPRRWRV